MLCEFTRWSVHDACPPPLVAVVQVFGMRVQDALPGPSSWMSPIANFDWLYGQRSQLYGSKDGIFH